MIQLNSNNEKYFLSSSVSEKINCITRYLASWLGTSWCVCISWASYDQFAQYWEWCMINDVRKEKIIKSSSTENSSLIVLWYSRNLSIMFVRLVLYSLLIHLVQSQPCESEVADLAIKICIFCVHGFDRDIIVSLDKSTARIMKSTLL